MLSGIQIALEFPENSIPPHISVEEAHAFRVASDDAPTARGSIAPPTNLQDLLAAIAASNQLGLGRLGMLRSTAAHLSRFLGEPPEKIELGSLADSLIRFRDYLRQRRFKDPSVRAYVYYGGLLIRLATSLGWKRVKAGVADEWKEILPVARRYKCGNVVRYAIRKGLGPGQFSEVHLQEMGQEVVQNGGTASWSVHVQHHFRKCVREAGLQHVLPGISPPRRKTIYAIPLEHFPEALRGEVSKLLKWKTDPYVDDRPVKSKPLRVASAAKLKEILCQVYGFAINIERVQPRTLAELLSQECLGEFLKWGESERKMKIYSLVKPVWMIVPIVRDYPLLRENNFSWFFTRLQAMQARAKHADVDRGEEVCAADYDLLAQIPGLIHREADARHDGEDLKKAILVRDQLLIKWLLVMPWRQRNLRECKLGNKKAGGNLFKEEVCRLKMPLPESRLHDPHQNIWVFHFGAAETKAGKVVQAVVPKQLVGLLEQYLELSRPRLVGKTDPGTLFVNDHGRPFSTYVLRSRVRDLTARYGRKIVNPHGFRHAFAFKYLKDHPRDYLTLSKYLWHTDVSVTIRIYGRDFDEAYAVCAMEEWLDQQMLRYPVHRMEKTQLDPCNVQITQPNENYRPYFRLPDRS